MSGSLETLVVGGGIAGLAAAKALERHDLAVELVEQRSDPATGKGFFLPANAVRALTTLGFEAPLSDLGTRIDAQELRDNKGDVLASIRLDILWHHITHSVGITHRDLHHVMQEGVQTPLLTGVGVVSVQEDDDGALVAFTDGSSKRYDLVIGADGVNSRLRHTVSPGTVPTYMGQACWRFLTDNNYGIDRWTVWMGRGTSFLAVPVGPGRLYCYADATVPAEPPHELGLASQRDLFAGYDSVVRDLIGTPDAGKAHFAPVQGISTDRWASRRTVLIGDAAHATPPNMAQGVAMAAEDALVLAESLTRPGVSVEQALTLYQDRRRPRTDWVRAQTRKRDRTRNLAPGIRNFMLRRAAFKLYDTAFGPLREMP